MNAAISGELSDALTAYLSERKSLSDFCEWLAGVDWDDPSFDSDSQSVVGLFELLATDVMEGFRPETEFAQEASDFVAAKTGSRYAVRSPQPDAAAFTPSAS